MKASQLIIKIRKNGGFIWLDELGRLNAEGVPEVQMKELSDAYNLVVALLREGIVSKRWENSGRDPSWWRHPEEAWSYPEQRLKPIAKQDVSPIGATRENCRRNISSAEHAKTTA
jgi:hypothetical protein